MAHPISQDYSDLIGIPYEDKDCWEAVCLFYNKIFGLELKKYYEKRPDERVHARKLIYAAMGDFDKVGKPQFGDILLFRFLGIDCHIGIYLGAGKIYHSMQNVGSIIDSYDKWSKCLTGIYRVRADD